MMHGNTDHNLTGAHPETRSRPGQIGGGEQQPWKEPRQEKESSDPGIKLFEDLPNMPEDPSL